MFSKLIKRIKADREWRKIQQMQAARAASIAVHLVLSGSLRKAGL